MVEDDGGGGFLDALDDGLSAYGAREFGSGLSEGELRGVYGGEFMRDSMVDDFEESGLGGIGEGFVEYIIEREYWCGCYSVDEGLVISSGLNGVEYFLMKLSGEEQGWGVCERWEVIFD